MIQSDRRIEYILFFKNHGRNAGASLLHPHAQMMALPMVPNDVRVRADEARHHFDEVGRCAFCEMIEQEVATAGPSDRREQALCRLYALCIGRRPSTSGSCPRATFLRSCMHRTTNWPTSAIVMHRVLRKLYLGLNNPDYNYAIRTAPVSDLGAAYLHWYITIVPRISYAAGFEIGSGIYINPSLPEECAAVPAPGRRSSSRRPSVRQLRPDDSTPDNANPPALNGSVSDE